MYTQHKNKRLTKYQNSHHTRYIQQQNKKPAQQLNSSHTGYKQEYYTRLMQATHSQHTAKKQDIQAVVTHEPHRLHTAQKQVAHKQSYRFYTCFTQHKNRSQQIGHTGHIQDIYSCLTCKTQTT